MAGTNNEVPECEVVAVNGLPGVPGAEVVVCDEAGLRWFRQVDLMAGVRPAATSGH